MLLLVITQVVTPAKQSFEGRRYNKNRPFRDGFYYTCFMSKKSKAFFIIGCVLVVAAFLFVLYAMQHPESSFPWPNSITYAGYAVYICITISFFSCFSGNEEKTVIWHAEICIS